MIRYLYCFIFTCFLWHLSAQKIVVVDETSLEPIAGVAIFNLVKTKTDVSSLDGSILISRFQSFERIHFQHLSYRKTSKLKSKINDTIFLIPK